MSLQVASNNDVRRGQDLTDLVWMLDFQMTLSDVGPGALPEDGILELVREERPSSETAATLLGLSKARFVSRLDRPGIAYFTETPAEMAAQDRRSEN